MFTWTSANSVTIDTQEKVKQPAVKSGELSRSSITNLFLSMKKHQRLTVILSWPVYLQMHMKSLLRDRLAQKQQNH